MKKILTLAASTSSTSINAKLVAFASLQLSELSTIEVISLNLKDYDMPLFCEDRKKESGVPAPAQKFKKLISECDALLISFAEHNGTYTAAFKNLLDWTSVLEGSMWQEKPMCLLATSPGGRGGKGVLQAASDRFPRMGGKVLASFSLPSFKDHFEEGLGITDEKLAQQLAEVLNSFNDQLMKS